MTVIFTHNGNLALIALLMMMMMKKKKKKMMMMMMMMMMMDMSHLLNDLNLSFTSHQSIFNVIVFVLT